MSGLIYKNGQKESINWMSLLVGPLLTSFLAAVSAGFVTYVGVQKEMASMSNDVNKLSKSVDKLTTEQDSFFKSQYIPLLLKVEKHDAELSDNRASMNLLKEEIRLHHPVGREYGRRKQ